MTDCASFKDLAASLALDTLSPSERAEAEAHLLEAQHDGCLETLCSAMDGVAAIGGPMPPPRVWARIEARVRASRPPRRAALSWTGWAVAAALLFVIIGLVARPPGRARLEARLGAGEAALTDVTFTAAQCRTQLRALESQQQTRDEAVALLERAGTRLYPLPATKGTGAQANAILHTGLERAFVVADGLPAVAEHHYELWIAKGTRIIAVGPVQVDAHGRGVARVDYARLLGEGQLPDAMMITVEARDASATTPGPTVVIGPLHG